MSIISKKCFHDEKAAFAHLEAVLWADGPICPHCGVIDKAGRLDGVKDKNGRVRNGLWKCYACRKQFTVRVGTVFESAHIPLPKMLQAVYLMCASKKGISAHQLHRTLEITYKSAWFLAHRIREAMRDGSLAPMGSTGGQVEIDDTFIGKQSGHEKERGPEHKNIVLSLVDRQTGVARSFHIEGTGLGQLLPIVRTNIRREAGVMTDSAFAMKSMGKEFAQRRGTHDEGDAGCRRQAPDISES